MTLISNDVVDGYFLEYMDFFDVQELKLTSNKVSSRIKPINDLECPEAPEFVKEWPVNHYLGRVRRIIKEGVFWIPLRVGNMLQNFLRTLPTPRSYGVIYCRTCHSRNIFFYVCYYHERMKYWGRDGVCRCYCDYCGTSYLEIFKHDHLLLLTDIRYIK